MNARIASVVAVGAAAALVAGLLWSRGATVAPSPGPSAPTPGSTAPGAPASAITACRFQQGQTFSFDYRSETHARLAAVLPGTHEVVPQTAAVELTGVVTFEVLSVHTEDAVLVGRLSGVNASATRAAGPTLEAAFLTRVNERCELTAFARARATPQVAARAQHVLASDLSFSIGDGSPASEALFPTSLGQLRALVLRGEEPGRFVRKAVNYTSHWVPRMAQVHLVEGEVDVRRGASAWVERLTGHEEVGGGEVQFSKTDWSVIARAVDPAALSGASRREEDYVWVNALGAVEAGDVVVGNEAQDHQRRVVAARDLSFETAMTRFGAKLEAGANINEQWRDMAAWLDAHPEQIPDYVDVITDEAFPAGGKAPAFLALGQAQDPLAREALLGVFREPEAQQADRMRSSLALSMRKDVGLPLAKELKAVASSTSRDASEVAVARQAVLHLGVLAGTHQTQADVVAESLSMVSTLSASAKTADDYSVLFGLVGNMAELSLLPRIAEWSKSPDPVLRRELPDAIRRYRVDRVHDLVVEWLARETDADVKRELFNTLHHMYVDAGRPVEEDLMREALRHLAERPLVLTRQSLYHLLTPYGERPEVQEALTSALTFELSEKSGLYSLVAQALPAERIYEALRVGVKPPERAAVTTPTPSSRPLNEAAPAGFDAVMREALNRAPAEEAP